MNPTLIAGLKASARHIAEAGHALTTAAESLTAVAASLEHELAAMTSSGTETPIYKKPNGRLSDAGGRKVAAEILAGRTDAEIAADLSVHPSAITKRRRLIEKAA